MENSNIRRMFKKIRATDDYRSRTQNNSGNVQKRKKKSLNN